MACKSLEAPIGGPADDRLHGHRIAVYGDAPFELGPFQELERDGLVDMIEQRPTRAEHDRVREEEQ